VHRRERSATRNYQITSALAGANMSGAYDYQHAPKGGVWCVVTRAADTEKNARETT
jgi:hypothetical protein